VGHLVPVDPLDLHFQEFPNFHLVPVDPDFPDFPQVQTVLMLQAPPEIPYLPFGHFLRSIQADRLVLPVQEVRKLQVFLAHQAIRQVLIHPEPLKVRSIQEDPTVQPGLANLQLQHFQKIQDHRSLQRVPERPESH